MTPPRVRGEATRSAGTMIGWCRRAVTTGTAVWATAGTGLLPACDGDSPSGADGSTDDTGAPQGPSSSDSTSQPASSDGGADTDPPAETSDTGEATSGHRIFVTSRTYTGGFATVQEADTRCAGLAEAAGLSGSWIAWLSSETSPITDRVGDLEGSFSRIDGALVADDLDDLLDGELARAIELDETGAEVFYEVWTGTLSDGTTAPFHCESWTIGDGAATGRCGAPGQVGPRWTDNVTPACGTRLGLYCVEL